VASDPLISGNTKLNAQRCVDFATFPFITILSRFVHGEELFLGNQYWATYSKKLNALYGIRRACH
jgi:hypothetical protein